MRRLPQPGLLIALALLALGASPAASQGGARLHLPLIAAPELFVFVSDRDSGSSIVEAAPDGSARRTLSGPTTNDSAPALSPDGVQLAVVASPTGISSVYTLRRDGGELRDLGSGSGPLWAPDGASLLMANHSRSPLRLCAQAAGAAATPIAYGELPALAPGDRRLAFVRGGKLFTIGTDGQHERALADTLTVVARPAWSPDGARIAAVAHSSSYTKLHMPPSFANCCGPIPAGHGNVLDYAVAL
jgi:hypothetical protein